MIPSPSFSHSSRSRDDPICLLPHRYFALTSLVMSNVLLSIIVSAYIRMQQQSKELFVVSLLHIAGRSIILTPRQIMARYLCLSRWAQRTCRPRVDDQPRKFCAKSTCETVRGPVRQLRELAIHQKDEVRTASLRVRLHKLGFTSYQSDRIVTQMQHFDRIQAKRKIEQIQELLVRGSGT